MQIAVGSKNPAKIHAVELAFATLGFHPQITGVDVPSGVRDQPFSDDETMTGAINRAKLAQTANTVDYGIGLEGGVLESEHGMFICNWCAIAAHDGQVSVGGGVRLLLPDAVAQGVSEGRELGHVIDEWIGRKDIAKGEGTIGILTKGHITRAQMFRDAIICAFSKFL